MSRRLSVLIAALALSASAAACGGDDKRKTTATSGVVEYVGAVQGAHTDLDPHSAHGGEYFVAVAIDGAKVTAYACDSVGAGELFTGELDGRRIALTSKSGGATLRATVDGDTLSGDLTVNRRRQAFAATPAEGVGGLYTVSADGVSQKGRSEGGNTIAVSFDVTTLTYKGEIVTVGGKARRLAGSYRRADRAEGRFDEYRQVRLDSGIGRGSKTASAQTVRGAGWIDPDPTPVRWTNPDPLP